MAILRVQRVKGDVGIVRVCKDVRVQRERGRGYCGGTEGKGGRGYSECK